MLPQPQITQETVRLKWDAIWKQFLTLPNMKLTIVGEHGYYSWGVYYDFSDKDAYGKLRVSRLYANTIYVSGMHGCCGVAVIHNPSGCGDNPAHYEKLVKMGEDLAKSGGYTLLLATDVVGYRLGKAIQQVGGWEPFGEFTNHRTSSRIITYRKIVDWSAPYWFEEYERKETEANPQEAGPGPTQAQPGSEGRPPQPVA